MIWGNQEEEYFRSEDSTEIMRDLPVGQHKGLGWWGMFAYAPKFKIQPWTASTSLEKFLDGFVPLKTQRSRMNSTNR